MKAWSQVVWVADKKKDTVVDRLQYTLPSALLTSDSFCFLALPIQRCFKGVIFFLKELFGA